MWVTLIMILTDTLCLQCVLRSSKLDLISSKLDVLLSSITFDDDALQWNLVQHYITFANTLVWRCLSKQGIYWKRMDEMEEDWWKTSRWATWWPWKRVNAPQVIQGKGFKIWISAKFDLFFSGTRKQKDCSTGPKCEVGGKDTQRHLS